MDPKSCTRTKKDLIEQIATATGQSRSSVKRMVQVAFDYIVEELAEGNRLEFRDFGVFDAKVRPGRIAQNPKTLQPVDVPPRRTVKFKPSRSMRDRLKIDEGTDGTDGPNMPNMLDVSSSQVAQGAASAIEALPAQANGLPTQHNGHASIAPSTKPATEPVTKPATDHALERAPSPTTRSTESPVEAPVNPRGAAV